MSYRLKRLSVIMVALAALIALTAAHAEMRGNTYSSLQHRISFSRPDASWELRENPAQRNAVALLSNGQGRVIALLSHRVIDPDKVISSASELRDSWTQYVHEITAMGSTGETGMSLLDANYQASNEDITFDLNYTSSSPAMGGKLRNWVTGLMVRDSDGRQHIYALRCAAADGAYDAWVGQFELIARTLQFDGQRQTPFYTTAPIPWWWFALGGVAAMIVIMVLRRGRSVEPMATARVRQEPSPQTLPPPALDDGAVPNVPDQMLVAADLADVSNDVPDQMYHEAAAEGQAYEDVAPLAGLWKCDCGRMNSGDEDFCVRCNADRVSA